MKMLINVKHNKKFYAKGSELKDEKLFELFLKNGFCEKIKKEEVKPEKKAK